MKNTLNKRVLFPRNLIDFLNNNPEPILQDLLNFCLTDPDTVKFLDEVKPAFLEYAKKEYPILGIILK